MPYFIADNYKTPSIAEDDYWKDEWGSAVEKLIKPLNQSTLVDDKYFPKSGYLRAPCKTIPPLFAIEYWYCNEAIKSALEMLEPSSHRFHPFSLRDRKDGDEIANFYIINILDRLDAVDEDQSKNLHRSKLDPTSSSFQITIPNLSKHGGDLVLKSGASEGRHLWKGMGAIGPGHAFVSDKFYEIILRETSETPPFFFYKTR